MLMGNHTRVGVWISGISSHIAASEGFGVRLRQTRFHGSWGRVSHASIGVRIAVDHVTMRDLTLCLLCVADK